MDNGFIIMATIAAFVFAVMFYLLPTMIASSRKHNNTTAICLVNIFFGWCVAGWLIALIWASTDNVNRTGEIR